MLENLARANPEPGNQKHLFKKIRLLVELNNLMLCNGHRVCYRWYEFIVNQCPGCFSYYGQPVHQVKLNKRRKSQIACTGKMPCKSVFLWQYLTLPSEGFSNANPCQSEGFLWKGILQRSPVPPTPKGYLSRAKGIRLGKWSLWGGTGYRYRLIRHRLWTMNHRLWTIDYLVCSLKFFIQCPQGIAKLTAGSEKVTIYQAYALCVEFVLVGNMPGLDK